MTARRRVWRLLTLGGLLRVRVCGLCGALVASEGLDQHDRAHRAYGPNRGQR